MRLFSNRLQRTSKRGKNIDCASCATFLFLPHFEVICDLLLNRSTATWNLFVNSMNKGKMIDCKSRFVMHYVLKEFVDANGKTVSTSVGKSSRDMSTDDWQ